MFKANKKYVLLLLILVFSFIYRVVLMFWQSFPPGADIGLHASVINSITGQATPISCTITSRWAEVNP